LRRLRYLRAGARALGATGALVACLSAPVGCGPVEYLNQVSSKASNAVAAAKQANADRFAPYEYTAAVEYLHKAREEGGYAEYQIAIEYGRRAEDFATRARAIADEKGARRPKGAGTSVEPLAPAEPSSPGEDSP
jgi:hypothetical protein